MDRLTKEQRRKTMQAIKSKGSKIEKTLQNALKEKGYVFEKNYNKIKGNPDVAFLNLKIAVFCDSDFWHGYDWENKKFEFKSNRDFWWNKIEKNIERDEQVNKKLRNEGWTVLRFWGHEIKNNLDNCLIIIENSIGKNKRDE